MYVVVQVGPSQFKVSEGDVINVARIKDEKGADVTLDKVLLFSKDQDIRIGQPYLEDVQVAAKVVQHPLGKKVTAFKYRKRKNSSSKVGYRHKFTTLNITKISV